MLFYAVWAQMESKIWSSSKMTLHKKRWKRKATVFGNDNKTGLQSGRRSKKHPKMWKLGFIQPAASPSAPKCNEVPTQCQIPSLVTDEWRDDEKNIYKIISATASSLEVHFKKLLIMIGFSSVSSWCTFLDSGRQSMARDPRDRLQIRRRTFRQWWTT